MRLKFFGLLHLEEKEQSAMNLAAADFQDQIITYLKNAITLSNSLYYFGNSFKLITNRKDIIDEYLSSINKSLQVIEIPFITEIPKGTKFYSAHFKLDVYRYFSSLIDEYIIFCDLDVLCVNATPLNLINNVESRIPIFYDVSDQVIPAFGREAIIGDLSLINSINSEGRWAGGEFISGTPNFFKSLMEEIDNIYGNYIENLNSLRQVNDEPLVSAALELLRKKGINIVDAGTLGIIGRYWSVDTKHYQKPYDYFKQCFLIHLPADKKFLARQTNQEFTPQTVLENYSRYHNAFSFKKWRKRMSRRIRNLFT